MLPQSKPPPQTPPGAPFRFFRYSFLHSLQCMQYVETDLLNKTETERLVGADAHIGPLFPQNRTIPSKTGWVTRPAALCTHCQRVPPADTEQYRMGNDTCCTEHALTPAARRHVLSARTPRRHAGHEKTPSGNHGRRYFQRTYQAILFRRRVMLLFLRAAVFLCRIPLVTAWSTAVTAAL